MNTPKQDTLICALIAGLFAFITGLCFTGMYFQPHYLFAVVGSCSFCCTVIFAIGATHLHHLSSKEDDTDFDTFD